MITANGEIFAGIDTHRDTYAIATCDEFGSILKNCEFKTTKSGMKELVKWLNSQGEIRAVGIEGTGSYGKSITVRLQKLGMDILEVTAPPKKTRRSKGKNDYLDAQNAALTARDRILGGSLENNACASKNRTHDLENIRAVKAAYDGAKKMRTQSINAFKASIIASPEDIRETLQGLSTRMQVRKCANFRTNTSNTSTFYSKTVLKREALRIQNLEEELAEYKILLDEFASRYLKNLMELKQVGSVSAVQFFLTSGLNIERFASESAFAAHCGVAPIPASSGQHSRMRLSRAGDRKANSALYFIAIGRMGKDDRTKAYVAKKLKEGKSKKDAIRCLKRYIAREVFRQLKRDIQQISNNLLTL